MEDWLTRVVLFLCFRPTASTESLQQLSRQINGILAEVRLNQITQ